MSGIVFAKSAIIVGVEGLVFCKVLTDTTTGTTYDESIHSLPGVQEIAITTSVSEDMFPADNIPTYDTASFVDSMEVSITVAALGREAEAFLLGRQMDANGVLMTTTSDVAPDVAMGFKATRKDGSIDYIWLYKGAFKPGDEKFRTQEKGKVNWQAPVVTGTFGGRLSDGKMRAKINTEDKDVTQAVLDSFFDAVYVPVAASEG